MSGSWSDSEYISSYSFILARGIRSICMITPEMLLLVMWACRLRHRVQIGVQLQVSMTSWRCWLLFIYKWVNTLIYIHTVTHTHMCKHACMHTNSCYILYPDTSVWGAAAHEGNMGEVLYLTKLVSLAPGMGSASLGSRRGWTSFASGGSCLFSLSSLSATSTDNELHPCLGSVRLLFSLGYSKCLRDREKKGHGWNLIEIGKGSLDKRAGANTASPFADALNVTTFLPGYLRASSSYASRAERVAYQALSWLNPSPTGLGKSLPSSSLKAELSLHQ